MIFIQIYQTTIKDPNIPGQSETESDGNEGFSTLSRSPKVEPHYQIQFSLIHERGPFLGVGLLYAGDTSSVF